MKFEYYETLSYQPRQRDAIGHRTPFASQSPQLLQKRVHAASQPVDKPFKKRTVSSKNYVPIRVNLRVKRRRRKKYR